MKKNPLIEKYRKTSRVYDILDYPWERQYRLWRPELLRDVSAKVLEAGVGTGRNLPFYSADCRVLAIDLSEEMLRKARERAKQAHCLIEFKQCDASRLDECLGVEMDQSFDWYISTFMYCVMPNDLQISALLQMARVLKHGGRFRLVEMVYSKNKYKQMLQRMMAPLVEWIYGARFDRQTLEMIQRIPQLKVTRTSFLRRDMYLLIEGERIS